jgi:Sel1 repeat
MNHGISLDVSSFQKLLEAAWVLQCERDRERSETHNRIAFFPISSDDESNAVLPLPSPGNVFEPAKAVAEAHTPPIEIVDASVIPTPSTAAPIYQRAEVAGALALAADQDCPPLRDPIPFPAPDVLRKPVRGTNETAVAEISRRVVLSLGRFRDKYSKDDKELDVSVRSASNFKRASRVATAYAAPVVVLLIMFGFLFSLLASHRPVLTALKAALPAPKIAVDASLMRDHVGHAQSAAGTGNEQRRTELSLVGPALVGPASVTRAGVGPAVAAAPVAAVEPPSLEASHLRVTDAAASSLVGGLSPYEIQTVRQQAQYGDAAAALTLGMAYEIGRHVPQSCAQAAHWVAVAAEEGDSAAQYNLGLRYLSGDGIPSNLDEAKKWLRKAAGHGYQKASLTLQASRLQTQAGESSN